METGTNILSYQGNSGLGLGANADIPAINPNANLNVINQTARDILLADHEDNLKLYAQKIDDRDNTLKLLAQGQIASGDIDPNDRPHYDAAKKEVQDAFFDMIKKGGINNPEAYKNYLGKVTELSNVVTHAQSRNLELSKLEQERAAQTLPSDIEDYTKWINQEKSKDFWQPIDPFQKAFSLNLPQMMSSISGQQPSTEGVVGTGVSLGKPSGQITNAKSKTPLTMSSQQVNPDGTISPISFTPERYWDLPTLIKNAQQDNVSDPTQAENQRQWLDKVTAFNETGKKQLLDADNQRLAQYSAERGIAPIGTDANGNPVYEAQIKYVPGPDGRIQINETPATFAAKHTLASVSGNYVQKPQPVFNKDIGSYDVALKKASTDAFYKRAMAGAAQEKAGAYAANLRQQMKLRKTAEDQDNFLNEIYNKNLTEQPLVQSRANKMWSLAPINAQNSLPVYTLENGAPKQLIPIGAKARFSNDSYTVDANGNRVLKAGAKPLFYEGGYYQPQYYLNGQILKPEDINQLYQVFKKNQGSKWKGGLDDFLKGYIKNDLFQVKLKGANGSTDKDVSMAAQRIIANKATKKGQDLPFSDNEPPPIDEQVPDNNNDNSQ